MSDSDQAPVAGTYVLDRQTYLSDMRDAFHTQVAELEAMLRKARVAEEFAPSELGGERLKAFEEGVEKVRSESEQLLSRVPDPLTVELELREDGTFRMEAHTPAGSRTGSGTWTTGDDAVVLVHLEENELPLGEPVTEALAIRDGALEKRASTDHFPFFLRPA